MDEPRAQASAAGPEHSIAQLQSDVASLKSYIEGEVRRIDQVNGMQKDAVATALIAAEKAVNAALAAADKQTEKSESNTKESFSKVNELRGMAEDLGKLMATKTQLEDFKFAVTTKFDDLQKQLTYLASRLDLSPETRKLESRADVTQASGRGMEKMYGWITGGAGLLLAIIVYLMKGR